MEWWNAMMRRRAAAKAQRQAEDAAEFDRMRSDAKYGRHDERRHARKNLALGSEYFVGSALCFFVGIVTWLMSGETAPGAIMAGSFLVLGGIFATCNILAEVNGRLARITSHLRGVSMRSEAKREGRDR